MLFHPPDDDALYAALLARDPAYEGRALVAVVSTGVFCRLTCPARKPRRENCRFFASAAEAAAAGFRPCKRCKPVGAGLDPAVGALLEALNADPARRWRESDIAALGHNPSTIRRAFRRHFGATFLQLARAARLRAGARAMAQGARVIDAQLDAGFDSPAGFRAAFARLMGAAPGSFAANAPLKADWIDTALGPMVAVADAGALRLLEFADRPALPRELAALRRDAGIGFGRVAPMDAIARELEAFFAGRAARFETQLNPGGTDFERRVWAALRAIPPGETRAYGQIAAAIGRPGASRAVARANGANRIAIAIPCHRVIGADGSLTGYGGGLWRKRKLIELERGFAAERSLL